MASTISVRFAPTRPAIPKISPLRKLKETSLIDGWFTAVKCSTSSVISFGTFVFSGKRCVNSRPTIIETISSMVVPLT